MTLRRPAVGHAAELTLAAACAALVWWLFVRTVAPVDLEVFLRAGRSVRAGVSPYVDPTSARVWSGHAFVYPYLTAWWFAPLSRLQEHLAALLYFVASVAALLATVRLVGDPRRRPLLIVVVLATEPVVRALQLGTLNVWLLLGLAVAWRWRGRAVVVVATLSTLVVAKLFLLPMLAWLVLTRRVRSAGAVAALSAVGVGLGCVVIGLPLSAFAHMLSALSAHEAPHSASVTSMLLGAGLGTRAAQTGAVVLAALMLAGAWWRYRRTADERVVFAAGVVASLVTSPIVWSHYFALVLLIPLLWRWNVPALLCGVGVSWLVFSPAGSPELDELRSFPHSGHVLGLAALALTVVMLRLAMSARTTRRDLVADRDATAAMERTATR